MQSHETAAVRDEVNRYLRESADRVDHEMAAVIDDLVDDPWLRGAIRYHLGWADADFAQLPPGQRASGGKRLRPALATLCYQSAATDRASSRRDLDADLAAPFAAAVELLHNFSLVHDDIEDHDRTRRGRPTLWSLCGQAQAINVGDTLHALSFACLGRLQALGVEDQRTTALVAALSRAAIDLTVGQRRDMAFETQPDVNMEMYLRMIAGKTAALTACATFGGAALALGTADPAVRPRLASYRDFGRELGLGFQIRDDLLGIWGDQSDTGKPKGSDIRRRKKTMPVIFAFEAGTELARARLDQLYSSTGEMTAADEADIVEILEDCRADQFAQSLVEGHLEQARRALADAARRPAAVAPDPYLSVLQHLSGLLTSRNA